MLPMTLKSNKEKVYHKLKWSIYAAPKAAGSMRPMRAPIQYLSNLLVG